MNLFSDLPLFKEDNLLKRFEEIHNYIYANDGLSSQQTSEEIVKILFIKLFDENSDGNRFFISEEEWKNLKQGHKIQIFDERIADLFEQTKTAYRDIFGSDDRIRVSQIALGFIIHKLQNISFLDSSQDAKGLAFQKFLSHREKDGRGQFFTPEPVIDFCVEMIQPRLNETIRPLSKVNFYPIKSMEQPPVLQEVYYSDRWRYGNTKAIGQSLISNLNNISA